MFSVHLNMYVTSLINGYPNQRYKYFRNILNSNKIIIVLDKGMFLIISRVGGGGGRKGLRVPARVDVIYFVLPHSHSLHFQQVSTRDEPLQAPNVIFHKSVMYMYFDIVIISLDHILFRFPTYSHVFDSLEMSLFSFL